MDRDILMKGGPALTRRAYDHVSVRTQVNSTKNEGRELIEPITLESDGSERRSSRVERANEAGLAPPDSE